jgi:hypothetical protein
MSASALLTAFGNKGVESGNFAPRINGFAVPYVLAASKLPSIFPSGGTIAASGVVTLTTALQRVYGPCWMYFPAGAVVGGAAGLYYVNMTSTTVGQVYNDYKDNAAGLNFNLGIPSVLTPAVGSNVAYTQPLNTFLALASFQVPADFFTDGACLWLDSYFTYPNNANTKNLGWRGNATNFASVAVTTSAGYRPAATLVGLPARAGLTYYPSFAQPFGGPTSGTVVNATLGQYDVTQAGTVALAPNYTVAGDFITLEHFRAVVFPGGPQ